MKSGKSQAAAYPLGGNPGSSASPRASSIPSVAVRSRPKFIALENLKPKKQLKYLNL